MGRPLHPAHDALDALDDSLVFHILQQISDGQDLAALSRVNRRIRSLVAQVKQLSFQHSKCLGASSPLGFQCLVMSMVQRTAGLQHLSVHFGLRSASPGRINGGM